MSDDTGNLDFAEYLLRNLKLHHDDEKLCDIVLIAGNDGQRISAHRIVLAASSDYFSGMFTSQLIESTQQELTLPEIDGKILLPLIRHCYTNTIDINRQNVQDIMKMASLMQFRHVLEKCGTFLETHLDLSNCLGVAEIADRLDCQVLLRRANEVIAEQYMELTTTREFGLLSFERLSELISRCELLVDGEEDVFISVVTWIMMDYTRTKHFPDLLQNLRLPLLSNFLVKNYLQTMCRNYNCPDLLQKTLIWHSMTRSEKLSVKPLLLDCTDRKGQNGIFGIFCRFDELRDYITVERYHNCSPRWYPFGFINTRRQDFGVAILNDMIIIAGGCRSYGSAVYESVIGYNLDGKRSKQLTCMREKRMNFGLVEGEGFVYAVGGNNGDDILSSVERFNSETGMWSYIPPMSVVRSDLGVAYMRGRLYACGGCNFFRTLSLTEAFNPVKNTWTRCANMIHPRKCFAICSHKGYLYAMGGIEFGGANSVERYDPKTDTWTEVAKILNMASLPCRIACISMGDNITAILNRYIDERGMVIAVENYNVELNRFLHQSQRSEREEETILHLNAVVEVPSSLRF